MVNQFAGFWRRLGAWAIDSLIFLPLVPFSLWVWSELKSWAIVMMLTQSLLSPAYLVGFHALRGQSFGKMALGLKVEMDDAHPISWRGAIVRFSPLIAFQIVSAIGIASAIGSLSEPELMTASFWQKSLLIAEHRPSWLSHFQTVWTLWLIADVLVLVASSRKRAIHDLLGGTVVRRLRQASDATPESAG
jgi:uncharacterized RDD family membrane protein YckC